MVMRGELWTVAGSGVVSKPRPALVVNDDNYQGTTVTVVPFSSDDVSEPFPDATLWRYRVEPSATNGLQKASQAMADKLTSIPRRRLGQYVGRLSQRDLAEIERRMLTYLGIG